MCIFAHIEAWVPFIFFCSDRNKRYFCIIEQSLLMYRVYNI